MSELAEFLSVHRAAAAAGLSRGTIRRAIRSGALVASTVEVSAGVSWPVVGREALATYLRARARANGARPALRAAEARALVAALVVPAARVTRRGSRGTPSPRRSARGEA